MAGAKPPVADIDARETVVEKASCPQNLDVEFAETPVGR